MSQRDRVQVVVSEEGDLLYRLDELEASFAQHLCDELRCFLADSGAIGRWGARSAEAEHDGIRVRVSPLEGKCGGQCGGVQLVEIDRAPEKTTWEDFPLSPRQRQVGVAAASGETVPQIAARLQLSTNTVKAHLKRVYEVVGVHSRVELASRF